MTAHHAPEVTELLDPQDLEALRALPRPQLAGAIVALNRTPRYRNGLDVVRLVHVLLAERNDTSASSPVPPASSESSVAVAGGSNNFAPHAS